MQQALSEGQSIYRTDYVMQPIGQINLGLHTLTPIWFPVWSAVQSLGSDPLAVNVIIWLGLTLTGFVTSRYLQRRSGSLWLGLLGGAFFMLLPLLRSAAENAHLNLLGAFFYPLTLMLWDQIIKSRHIGWAVALGAVFWAMWLTDGMWLLLSVPILAPYGLWTLWHKKKTAQLILLGGLALLIFAGLSYAIVPWQQANSFDRSEVSPADRVAAERWSLDVDTFFFMPEDVGVGRSLGRGLMLLVIVSLLVKSQHRERWLWFGTALACMVLSLGPDITLGGQRITLPYWVLHEALGGLYRVPERFVIPFVFAILIFLALTWGDRFKKLSSRRQQLLSLALLALMLIDLGVLRRFEAGLPDQALNFYTTIGEDEADYVVMDVPVSMASGWARVGHNDRIQYHALTHGKRIVGGFIARVPDWYHAYFRDETVLGWLSGSNPLQDDTLATFENYVRELPIGYVIVHQSQYDADSATAEDLIGTLNTLDFLCPVTVEGQAMIYGTAAQPQRCQKRLPPEIAPGRWHINFGLPGDEFFIGTGFHRPEVIGGPPARWLGAMSQNEAFLYLELPPQHEYLLTFELTAFAGERPLAIYANEQLIAEVTVSPTAFEAYSVTLPADVFATDNRLALRLVTDTPQSAAELGLSGDARPLSIAINRLEIERR